MKKVIFILGVPLIFILVSAVSFRSLDRQSALKDRIPADPHLKEVALLPVQAGSVKPEGWIKEQMRLDIQEGLAGSYEKIWPNVALELFAKQEREPGNVKVFRGKTEGKQPAWWAGEHEGYWKDAVVRLAFLTDNHNFQERARKWMEDIIATSEKNGGYIGIYSPEARFPSQGIDGELWTQSRIFQAMLAYYEFTGEEKVLNAVEKAVSLTLNTYKNNIGTYFGRQGTHKHGGVSHGIGFLDTLEWLYRLTGEDKYKEGLVWFYNDFSNNKVRDDDMQLNALLEQGRVFQRHTPHIVEGLHGPQICASITEEEKYNTASENALNRLTYHTSPAGNIVGDELVHGRMGTAETLGEYCSMTQGVMSLNKIIAWGGSMDAAAKIENTVFNSAQAARFHPNNTAVQYLGRDNQYSAADTVSLNGRTMYAGYHRAAACCTLNSTRIMPYYVDGMWYNLKEEPGLLAMLYGPSRLKTNLKGQSVEIQQETMYPFNDKIVFNIKTEKPLKYKLKFRIPDGADNIKVDAGSDAKVDIDKDFISVTKEWDNEEKLKIDFNFKVQLKTAQDNSLYYTWGPLVFSLPIPADVKVKNELELISGVKSGFNEYLITPRVQNDYWNLTIDKEESFQLVTFEDTNKLNPWAEPSVGLHGKMIDENGFKKEVTLLPHGSSLLRRLTFPELP